MHQPHAAPHHMPAGAQGPAGSCWRWLARSRGWESGFSIIAPLYFVLASVLLWMSWRCHKAVYATERRCFIRWIVARDWLKLGEVCNDTLASEAEAAAEAGACLLCRDARWASFRRRKAEGEVGRLLGGVESEATTTTRHRCEVARRPLHQPLGHAQRGRERWGAGYAFGPTRQVLGGHGDVLSPAWAARRHAASLPPSSTACPSRGIPSITPHGLSHPRHGCTPHSPCMSRI